MGTEENGNVEIHIKLLILNHKKCSQNSVVKMNVDAVDGNRVKISLANLELTEIAPLCDVQSRSWGDLRIR